MIYTYKVYGGTIFRVGLFVKNNTSDLSAFTGAPALVIDDDSASRELLIDLLHELGFKDITEKKNGADAIEFLNQHKNWRGIILSDWNMPNMTGAELYTHVKKDNPEIPFIMVTARNDEESVIHAKDNGIYAYILKPFSLAELERKVTKVSINHSTFLFTSADADPVAVNYTI